MKKRNISTLLLVIPMLMPSGVSSSEASESLFPIAKEFAECTGVYKGVSNVLEIIGDPDTALMYNNVGNGSEQAARLLARDFMEPELIGEFVEERSSIGYNRVLVAYRSGQSAQQYVDQCEKQADLREEIVNFLLEQIYTQDRADAIGAR